MTDEQPDDRTDDEGEGQAVDSPAFEPTDEGSRDDPDGPAFDEEPEGNENIAEGRVGGLMGAPHATQGQGQGG